MKWEKRFEIMRRLCGQPEGKTIADLGAETSEGERISSVFDNKNDVQLFGREHGHDFEKRIEAKKDSFDVIIAGDVIEHLIKPTFFVKEIYRITKRGGILVLSVPNSCSLKNRVRTLLGKSTMNGAFADFSRDFHFSSWNMDSVCELIEKCGFRIEHKCSRFLECCIVKATKK